MLHLYSISLYCGDNKDYDLYGNYPRPTEISNFTFALFGSILSILLVVALWMNTEALHNELEHGDFFENQPIKYSFLTDISGIIPTTL